MMPVLKAEGRIARANDVGLGTGSLEESARERLTAQLAREAQGPTPQPVQKASAGDMAGMGIGLRLSAPKSEPSDE